MDAFLKGYLTALMVGAEWFNGGGKQFLVECLLDDDDYGRQDYGMAD